MKITFLNVGKNTDKSLETLIEKYFTRIQHYVKFEIRYVPDPKGISNQVADYQKQIQSNALLSVIKASDYIILLDERGKQTTSRGFAEILQKHLVRSTQHLVFIAGGPFGFSDELYKRANGMLSLSKMTFTHEMVRLIFAEQLYRAFTIINNQSYHHD